MDAVDELLHAIIVSDETRFVECHMLKYALLKLKIISHCNSSVVYEGHNVCVCVCV